MFWQEPPWPELAPFPWPPTKVNVGLSFDEKTGEQLLSYSLTPDLKQVMSINKTFTNTQSIKNLLPKNISEIYSQYMSKNLNSPNANFWDDLERAGISSDFIPVTVEETPLLIQSDSTQQQNYKTIEDQLRPLIAEYMIAPAPDRQKILDSISNSLRIFHHDHSFHYTNQNGLPTYHYLTPDYDGQGIDLITKTTRDGNVELNLWWLKNTVNLLPGSIISDKTGKLKYTTIFNHSSKITLMDINEQPHTLNVNTYDVLNDPILVQISTTCLGQRISETRRYIHNSVGQAITGDQVSGLATMNYDPIYTYQLPTYETLNVDDRLTKVTLGLEFSWENTHQKVIETSLVNNSNKTKGDFKPKRLLIWDGQPFDYEGIWNYIKDTWQNYLTGILLSIGTLVSIIKNPKKVIKSPLFLPLFSLTFVSLIGLIFGPVAVFSSASPFIIIGILTIIQDLLGANPNKAGAPFYLNKLEELPEGAKYPSASVVIPVYREPFNVLQATIAQAKKNIDLYNKISGASLANLVVLDDGFATLNSLEKDERLEFYKRAGVSVIARPPNKHGIFIRTGFFKKASNLNYAFALDKTIRETLVNSPETSENEVLEGLKKQEINNPNPQTRYDLLFTQGNILLGDNILFLDNDSYAPQESLLYSVHSLLRRPQVGFIQHASTPSNTNENFLTKVYSHSQIILWKVILKSRALYSPTGILGHNVAIRKSALADIVANSNEPGPWHEGRGADDLVPGLRMRTVGNKYYGILADLPFPDGGFKEGLPTAYTDLAGQLRRYGATATGSIFNPISSWLKEGIFRPEYLSILKDKNLSIPEKFNEIFWSQMGIQNLILMGILSTGAVLGLMGVEGNLGISFLLGGLFSTLFQMGMMIYLLITHSEGKLKFSDAVKAVIFVPMLYISLNFQNALGTGVDLFLSGAKTYGATKIRKSSEKLSSLDIIMNNKIQILAGLGSILLGVGNLFAMTYLGYSRNSLALGIFFIGFGLSFLFTPFIFENKGNIKDIIIENNKTKSIKSQIVSAPLDIKKDSEKHNQSDSNKGTNRIDNAMKSESNNTGGIDFSGARVFVNAPNGKIKIAFDDPALLNLLIKADGLTPVIYDINVMSASMIDHFVGLN